MDNIHETETRLLGGENVIADRLKNLWLIEKGLAAQKERIQFLEARKLYPTAEAGKNMEANTVNYMMAITSLYADCDRMYHEIAYLGEVVNTLESKQREVMRCRFICHMSLSDTAKHFNYSKRRIKQITKDAFTELEKKF